MNYIFPAILLIDAVIAFYYAVHYLIKGRFRALEGRLYILISIASGIWSAGFGLLILQNSEENAYLCRAFGMVGVFWYLIMAMIIVCFIAGVSKRMRQALFIFAGLGVILYFFVMRPGQTIFHLSEYGMTYHFEGGLINTLYTLYSCLIAICIMAVIVYMIGFAKLKKIRRFGIQLLIVEIVILVGMVLDTIFPLIGLAAIPGSSITQFLALLIIHVALRTLRQSRVDETNMAKYIYNSLANPVLVYDSDLNLKIANDAAHTFLRLGQSGAITSAYPINVLFQVEENDVFSFEGNDASVGATCIRNKIECNIAVSKILDAYQDLIGYILVVTDMSEHIQSMKNLQEAKEEADMANRSKSLFLANMSHEIRTPMNAILGFAELSLQEAMNPNVKDYVSEIKNSADTLLSLINQILDISKIESGKMELNYVDYDLETLIKDVYHIIALQAKSKQLDFDVQIINEIPSVLCGDRTRICEILINLLGNAVKYTSNGSIRLEIEVAMKSEYECILLCQVIDTGMGIKEEDLDKIFESFSRVDVVRNQNIEGTGLGLSLVKGYVDVMGGTLAVESEYGSGSKFSVVIPQWVKDATMVELDVQKLYQSVAEKSMGELRVDQVYALIVDDNPVNLKVIQKTLEHYGLVVDCVSSGKDAIASCMENRYDIVFMDQMMPEIDGIEAMQEIRMKNTYYRIGGKSQIVVLTANAITGAREELLAKGFDEYLSKPIVYKELERVFTKVVDKDKLRYVSDEQHEAIRNQKEEASVSVSEEKAENEVNVEPATTLEVELPMLDVAVGMMYCGGEEEDYIAILELLVESSEEQISNLIELWNNRDWKNYTIQIHALKGGLLNIGYEILGERAKALEYAGREQQADYILEHLSDFIADYQAFVEHLKVVLKKRGIVFESDAEQFSLEEYKVALRDKLQAYDFAGMSELIRKALGKAQTKEDKQAVEQLKALVDAMDLDGLAQILA